MTQQVNKGAFSTVYRPITLRQGQAPYVIKRPNISLTETEMKKLKRKYKNQKSILDSIHKQNPTKSHYFNQIYSITQGGQSVMKDLGGRDLGWYIKNKNHGLSDNVNDIIQQLEDAVVAMLSSGVAHRDIKPENIMAQYDESTGKFNIILVDFADSITKPRIDRSKSFLDFGTPRYMSPQALGRRQENNYNKGDWTEYVANDLWSLGIVIYTLLYDKQPLEVFRALYPQHHNFTVKKLYKIFRDHPEFYNDKFFPPIENKYMNDLRSLLSLDPGVRLKWFEKKLKKQQQQTKRTHDAISKLLSASETIEKKRKK